MLPAFDIDGGPALAIARGLSVGALLSVFGALVFRAWVMPRVDRALPDAVHRALGRQLLGLVRWSVAAGLAGLLAWLVLAAGDMADAADPMQALRAVPATLGGTRFGHLVVLQALALLGVAAASGRGDGGVRRAGALTLAGAGLALQAGHGHAASMEPASGWLVASELAHLFGAGAWLGGLLPLWLLIREAPARAGALAARWFSPLGKLCLYALTGSALVQGWVLVGSVPGLVGTAYGWMALVKLRLFGVLFGLAALNRYRLAPALLRTDPAAARRTLLRSIGVQTGFALAIVAAAAVLASIQPAMHTQPLWPFPQRFTLDTVNEDPAFRTEALGAVLALAGAAALLVLAGFRRRWQRWSAVAAAVVVAAAAAPHLDLLFVPATPTSYYRSPTGFAATSIVQGAALYPAHCASCHGAEGHGDGPAAAALPVPPADLTAEHLWMHSDGELFWWLTQGMAAPDGRQAMPGFAATLSEADRWSLIDFVRAHNAGLVFRATKDWSPPLPAPDLQADCGDGRTTTLADLRGGFVRLVFGTAPPLPGVTTILASADPAARPAPGLCVAADETLARAYAVVGGVAPAALPGAAFLIDGAGWLRAMRQPGWDAPGPLAADIKALQAHPVTGGVGAGHPGMAM